MKTHNGSINKADLVRSILRTMPSPIDYGKVIAACNARLEQLPEAQRKGVKIKRGYIHQIAHKLRAGGSPAAVAAPSAARIAPPPADTYSPAELLAAGRFFQACGNSLHRANSLLRIIADVVATSEVKP